jgi:hypothetical protein
MVAKKSVKKKNPAKVVVKKGSSFTLLRVVMLLAIIAIVASTLTIVFYINTSIIEVVHMPYYFRVQDHVAGINADTDRFAFGSTPPGGEGRRQFTLTTEKDAFVLIEAYGDGSEMIGVNRNAFDMAADTNITLDLWVVPPLDAEERTYEGMIRVVFLRPGRLSPNVNPIPVS